MVYTQLLSPGLNISNNRETPKKPIAKSRNQKTSDFRCDRFWMSACFVEGMSALMTVDESCRNPDVPLPSSSLDGKTRTFFMAAEEVLWNYAPSELNKLTNESLLTQGRYESIGKYTTEHKLCLTIFLYWPHLNQLNLLIRASG